jgi:hypothetical protein
MLDGSHTSVTTPAPVQQGQLLRFVADNVVGLMQADAAPHLIGYAGVARSGLVGAGALDAAVNGITPVLLETGLTPVAGQLLYVSATVPGRATNIAPVNLFQIGSIKDASAYTRTGLVIAVVAGVAGGAGGLGAQGAQGSGGAQGSAGAQGATGAGAQGSQGANGVQGAQGSSGAQGATGTGAQGSTGAQGAQGATGTGAQGAQGTSGAQGAQGASGTQGSQGATGGAGAAQKFAMFYGLTAGTGNGGADDYTATVPVNTGAGTGRVPFPRNGPANGILRVDGSSFTLPDIGTYEVTFKVHTTEEGQLELELNGAPVPESETVDQNPTSGGHLLVGNALITTVGVNEVLAVINCAGNPSALTITQPSSVTNANAQSIVIKRIA